MRYKAIIFDLDGTVANTEIAWELAIKKLIDRYVITTTPEQKDHIVKQLHGSSLYEATAFLKTFFDLEKNIDTLMLEKTAIAHDLFKKHITFIDGFRSFHKNIVNRGYKTAIATNATIKDIEIIDQSLNLTKFFNSHIYCMGHVNNISKPNPAIYLYAANQLEVLPKECIAIEDSAIGITAAKKAGMKCFAINTSKCKDQLINADNIVDRYDQIKI